MATQHPQRSKKWKKKNPDTDSTSEIENPDIFGHDPDIPSTCRVPVDVILANLMDLRMNRVTIRQLNLLKERIWEELHTYIDTASNALILAIDCRPDLFVWDSDAEEEAICKNEISWKLSRADVESYFNWRIPDRIKGRFMKILRETVNDMA